MPDTVAATKPRHLGAPPPLRDDCALFLDIDGTLLELAPTPDRVQPDPALIAVLRVLAARLGGALALSTGRSIVDADRLFPGLTLPIAGQHGCERRRADGSTYVHPPPPQGLERLRVEIAAFAKRHEGLVLEDKGSTIALHYRAVPQLAPLVHRTLRTLAAASGAAWSVQDGKRVAELRPADRDKGAAIVDFMDEAPFRGRRPVFVGDDHTDEYGFAAVVRMAGCAVKVGPGPTAANYRLPDIGAVHAWLRAALPSTAPC
jgi:trehalose 6-phosphate phosphatase